MNKPQQDKDMADSNRLLSGGDCEFAQGKEPSNGVKANNAANPFVLLRETSNERSDTERFKGLVPTSTGDDLTSQSNKLEPERARIILSPKAMDRIINICSQPSLLVDIGQAFPLLVWVVRQCEQYESCVVSYHKTAEYLKVGHSTIKNWANHLVALGLISKEPKGSDGVEIWLSQPLLVGDQEGITVIIRTALLALQKDVEAASLVFGVVTKNVVARIQCTAEVLK